MDIYYLIYAFHDDLKTSLPGVYFSQEEADKAKEYHGKVYKTVEIKKTSASTEDLLKALIKGTIENSFSTYAGEHLRTLLGMNEIEKAT